MIWLLAPHIDLIIRTRWKHDRHLRGQRLSLWQLSHDVGYIDSQPFPNRGCLLYMRHLNHSCRFPLISSQISKVVLVIPGDNQRDFAVSSPDLNVFGDDRHCAYAGSDYTGGGKLCGLGGVIRR